MQSLTDRRHSIGMKCFYNMQHAKSKEEERDREADNAGDLV
jgi:hypothetical protein